MSNTETKDPMEYVMEKGEKFIAYVNNWGVIIRGILNSIWYNSLMALFLFFAFFVLMLVLSPLLVTSENASLRGAGAAMYNFVSFTGMCHQLPQRSIRFLGAHMPVDARSFAIYLGAVLGGLLPMASKRVPPLLRSWRILPLAITPIILDGFSQTVFALRESNNMLRFLTGIIFGFGFVCFSVSYIFRKYPDFRSSITKKENLLVTFLTTAFLAYLVLSSLGASIGGRYLSRQSAVELATDYSNRSWGFTEAYYLSPHLTTSVHYDPFLEGYDDFVLKDVRDLDWGHIEALSDERGYNVLGLTGLWTVVLSDEKPYRGGKTVFTNVPGEYHYIDPVYNIVLEVKQH